MTARTTDTKLFHKLVNAERKNYKDIAELHVNDNLFNGHDEILTGFKGHFQKLATQSLNADYDSVYHELCRNEIQHIEQIVNKKNTTIVTRPIYKINKGEAPDIFGITIEHIIHADKTITEYLIYIYNSIFQMGVVPDLIKTGLLTPVYKNKGSRNKSTSYRCITVLPVLNKIIEAIIKIRIQPNILQTQNPSQRGFTAKTSPLNAAFIIEELKRNSKDDKELLSVTLLDAKFAFDVVNTDHLLRRLYQIGIDDKIWNLVYNFHENATSAVKWIGQTSTFFKVSQGVRQGGILSADLYNIYVNPLLDRLNKTGLGAKVGDIICNTSACADDVTINTYSDHDVQILLDIAADFANQERYELQPSKTNSVRIKPSHRLSISGEMQTLLLNDSEIPEVEQATHIGLKIANTISNAAKANIENNINKARRAPYSLMSTGLHGNNGLDPETSLQLIKTCITPILLYGLELILPNKTLITKLERFQKKLLKQVLSLPQNKPDCAVYLLT